ncbi:hypothetical protein Tco_1034168 [Tanacetum coccineum]
MSSRGLVYLESYILSMKAEKIIEEGKRRNEPSLPLFFTSSPYSLNEEDRDDPEFKFKENEEASQSDIFLSTQQVRELINDVFDTPSLGPNSVQEYACVSELTDADQPSLVKNVLDDVHIDSVVKDAEESKNPHQKFPSKDLTRSPTAPKRTVSVHKEVMALFHDKNKMEMCWTFPWVDDGHLVQIEFWEKLVGRSHTKRGWLSSDHLDIWTEYLWQFRDPNADWAIASPYLSDSRFEYPLYYADGVKSGVPWLSHNIPLEVDDPISFVLAYRERMIEFY